MNDITKLALIDELEKIGFVDFDKEAFLGGAMRAVGKGAGKLLGKSAPKAMPAMSPAQMAAQKARWAAGAGKSGQMTRQFKAPSAAMRPMGGGNVGAGSFAPAMA
jgi:hypothetical protein